MRKRNRVLWVLAVGLAVTAGLWFWIGWWSVLVLGVVVWMVWDPVGFMTDAETSGRAPAPQAYRWPSP